MALVMLGPFGSIEQSELFVSFKTRQVRARGTVGTGQDLNFHEKVHPLHGRRKALVGSEAGLSLVEVVVALGIAGVMVIGLVSGYMQTVRVAEWSNYSLAANSMALQGLEQVRAAKWDPEGGVDQVQASLFPIRWDILDIPFTKTNIVYATNRTTISTVSFTPPLRMIQVDCTWRFFDRGVYTNTVFTYRAPDQ
jgi:hypothetical protein